MAGYERELVRLEVTKVAVDTTTTSVKELIKGRCQQFNQQYQLVKYIKKISVIKYV